MSVSRTTRPDDYNAASNDGYGLGVPLELLVQDPEVVAELKQLDDEEREQFALRALKIGVLALKQARGQIDAETVRNEGKQLVTTLQGRLDAHSQVLKEAVDAQLRHYFDPDSGRLHERLQRLLKQDGELEQVLKKHLGEQDSELVRTLSAHLGEESPLLRHLDPEDSKGLLCLLRQTVDDQLNRQRERILVEFSLDHKDGALSRFIRELSERHGEMAGDLAKKIDVAVGEFSLDNEESALSRLVRNVHTAQKTIQDQFSLDEDQSALSRLKRILEATQESINSQLTLDDDQSALARLRKELTEILQEQQKSSREFQQEVTSALQAMQIRKEQAAKGTLHGIEFEQSLMSFIDHEFKATDDIVTATGNTTGRIKNCKIGDITLELGPESAAPGARITIEAKDKQKYQLAQAREEITMARDNRDAQVGLFVFARSNAPENLESLTRIGNDVFVVWDPEDTMTDLYLKTAITLAKALCVRARQHNESHSADFLEIDKAILEVEKQIAAMDDVETWVRTIASNSEKILKKIATMRKSLLSQSEVLRERTESLKVIAEG